MGGILGTRSPGRKNDQAIGFGHEWIKKSLLPFANWPSRKPPVKPVVVPRNFRGPVAEVKESTALDSCGAQCERQARHSDAVESPSNIVEKFPKRMKTRADGKRYPKRKRIRDQILLSAAGDGRRSLKFEPSTSRRACFPGRMVPPCLPAAKHRPLPPWLWALPMMHSASMN